MDETKDVSAGAKEIDLDQHLAALEVTLAKSAEEGKVRAAARAAARKELRDNRAPCPHCAATLVSDENDILRLDPKHLAFGELVQIYPDPANVEDMAFNGCFDCFTRPARNWESLVGRVAEIEKAERARCEVLQKIQGENLELDARNKQIRTEIRTVLGTLNLRWISFGLALATYEAVKFIVFHMLLK